MAEVYSEFFMLSNWFLENRENRGRIGVTSEHITNKSCIMGRDMRKFKHGKTIKDAICRGVVSRDIAWAGTAGDFQR